MQRSPTNFNRQTVRTVCFFWVLTLLGLAMGASSVSAQHKTNRLRPRYLSDDADPARGVEVMEHFRNLGIAGDYFLEFNLEVLPRRGERSQVDGRMWGSRNALGPVFRAELQKPDAREAAARLLGQNGAEPRAWHFAPAASEDSAPAAVQELSAATLLDPLVGTGLSMFELQMPFIHWPDYVYEGVTRVRGRAVHAFLMYPPETFGAAHPQIAGVRLHLDAQFNALMQAVILDGEEQPKRKLTVLDLKKLGEQWIVKSIDVRDEQTRDKVRFEVTGAALDLDFTRGLFMPDALREKIGAPTGVKHF